MKRMLMIFVLVLALTATTALSAGATMISGYISFSGHTSFDSLFTRFETFDQVKVNQGDGNYSAIPIGTGAMFTPFVFVPPAQNVIPLWSFIYGGLTYSFNATSMVVDFKNANNILISGAGMAYISGGGFDPTPGVWSLTGNRAGTTASFSSSAEVVPEPATMLLFGSGLLGLAVFARRKFHRA